MPEKSFPTNPGVPTPLGVTCFAEGINFALFSRHAKNVSLVLFKTGEGPKFAEIPLDPGINRTGDIWHILVHDLDPVFRYGYRITGPYEPEQGHLFSPENILLDPYAKALTGGTDWGKPYIRTGPSTPESRFHRRCCIVNDPFDWEGDRPLKIPLKDSIIYEMHVRGFTQDTSSGVHHPGTYHGIIEKIPYLRDLGITAVELMPVTEFNENENINTDPETGLQLKNFWGYSPLAFFSPKASYAVNGRNGHQVWEFKEMVKALHKAGIEVILDIVFNHTAEGGSDGPVFNFRGIDNTIYYLLDPETRDYLNFSGCGNTMNCNHPVVRNLIMDCLHYWVMEMHVDGFRFDLASIMGRDRNGEVMKNPPMVEQIAEDPILADTKIIAEAWDAAGLYQVGSFSTSARWAEWNGKYRDDVRSFMAGFDDSVAPLATRISGSADLYQRHHLKPFNSINFINSHDGFTLYDLVSYNQKHNLANGEKNRDGNNNTLSWNSGVEGNSNDPEILALRFRRIRSFAVILFLSQGAPMFVAGDEFGRTQLGNNNAYCQDNAVSWIDWTLAEKHADLHRFFKLLIRLRMQHPIFRRSDFFKAAADSEIEEIIWQSTGPEPHKWSSTSKELALFLNGACFEDENDFFIMLNSHKTPRSFSVPPSPRAGHHWRQIINTSMPSPHDFVPEEEGVAIIPDNEVIVDGMGTVVFILKPKI
jgi:glycogen operon protein